ncbi:MAG TPA: RnfABCDGE type electron transport complex subunit G [bacterium]|nr:RnfABCDGE type electron transport complex subunit G [bacterium]HOL66127.1 RnfABCDGE type electron transport complex subunit G [bacterium]HPP12670.1 RnfABCDGE type electron transport complex subunit G [bacterium]
MKKSELVQGVVVLLVITIAAGLLLAQVYAITLPRIEEQKRKETENLFREMFPEGVRFEKEPRAQLSVTRVYDGQGNHLGSIVEQRATGYGGLLVILVGVEKDGAVRKVKILQHNETPGLGAKVAQENFLKQFERLGLENLYLKSEQSGGRIDAISGATISSRAVTEGVRKALQSLLSSGAKETSPEKMQ